MPLSLNDGRIVIAKLTNELANDLVVLNVCKKATLGPTFFQTLKL